jgi:hypothetical protein
VPNAAVQQWRQGYADQSANAPGQYPPRCETVAKKNVHDLNRPDQSDEENDGPEFRRNHMLNSLGFTHGQFSQAYTKEP